MSYFDRVIKFTLYSEENDYKNLPKGRNEGDKGGITRCGLCTKYDSQYFPKGKTIDDLTLDDIIKIFHDHYWTSKFDDIKSYKIAARTFDLGVNRGFNTSIKFLQKACNKLGANLDVDGRIGNMTVNTVNSLDVDSLYNALVAEADDYYHFQVEEDSSNEQFLEGWIVRLYRDIEADCY